MPKRRNANEENIDATPRKLRRTRRASGDASSPSLAQTPSNRKSILKGTPTRGDRSGDAEPTPKSLRTVLFSTPARPAEENGNGTPTATRNERSARRKSAKALQQRSEDNGSDEEEEDAHASELAKAILDGRDAEESDDEETNAPTSSVATSPKKRGRPKGKKRERTPSPPPDLPAHELYFFQNRTGSNKTSANTLQSHVLVDHEDYHTHLHSAADTHETDIKRLRALHKRGFDQWMFELSQDFSLCLYGYGSKRNLAMDFASHLHFHCPQPPKIVVVNGYTPGLTLADILKAVIGALLGPKGKYDLPSKPESLASMAVELLTQHPSPPLCLIVHSLDHPNLRAKAQIYPLLARLAAHRGMNLVATCDNPNFGLLWNSALLRDFSWLYHDATTFESYIAELDVVEEVNQLLGRGRRRLGGKDGVAYVLKSLPENARNLFRILVAEQLALVDAEASTVAGADVNGLDDDILGAEDEETAVRDQGTPSRRGRGRPQPKVKHRKPVIKPVGPAPEGVEYRTLYNKAVEEFVCSSELNFRTLLKEFHDHQMIESRKDAMGTERLVVPFGKEELEGVLEELI